MINNDCNMPFAFNKDDEKVRKSGFVFEALRMMSIDDWDDDDEDLYASKGELPVIKDDQPVSVYKKEISDGAGLPFNIKIKRFVFDVLGINQEDMTENSEKGRAGYATTRYTAKDGEHNVLYICYNVIKFKVYTYKMYFDFAEDGTLRMGNCNNFAGQTKWMNIGIPFIKVATEYGLPFYIGDVYLKESYRLQYSAEDSVNNIQFGEHQNITDSVSFFRNVWDDKSYYLPDMPAAPGPIDVPAHLKLSHEFVKNFQGVLNTAKGNHLNPTILYTSMFESSEDFAKVANILCEAGFSVKNEYGQLITPDNYKELLSDFKGAIDNVNADLNNRRAELAKHDAECKEKIIKLGLLSEDTLDKFDRIKTYINPKDGNHEVLKVSDLASQRKTKDAYGKFDYNIIEELLQDNGIDVKKFLDLQNAKWRETANKLINKLVEVPIPEDMKKFPEYSETICNYRLKQAITPEELTILMCSYFNDEDIDELCFEDRHSSKDTDRVIYGEYLFAISRLFKTRWATESVIDEAFENSMQYFKWQFLARFVYIVAQQTTQSYIDRCVKLGYTRENINVHQLLPNELTDIFTTRNHSYAVHDMLTPKNITFKLSNYGLLYDFLYAMAYAIENAYEHLDKPNIVNEPYIDYKAYTGSASAYDLAKGDERCLPLTVKQIFDTNNTPNLSTFNTSAIEKCFNAIFTKIDAHVNPKQKRTRKTV